MAIEGVAVTELGIVTVAFSGRNFMSDLKEFGDSGDVETKPDEQYEVSGYYKEGLVEVPDDWIEVEAPEKLKINSESFKIFE